MPISLSFSIDSLVILLLYERVSSLHSDLYFSSWNNFCWSSWIFRSLPFISSMSSASWLGASPYIFRWSPTISPICSIVLFISIKIDFTSFIYGASFLFICSFRLGIVLFSYIYIVVLYPWSSFIKKSLFYMTFYRLSIFSRNFSSSWLLSIYCSSKILDLSLVNFALAILMTS